jgi:putative PIN family toxin of toxin-antitoxin system
VVVADGATRIVLDTDVVLSALLFQSSALSRFRTLWQRGTLEPLVSADTTTELLRVLGYPKFKLTEDERHELLHEYLPYATVVKPSEHPNALNRLPICRDPSDEMFLELAQAGDATFLVTGDRDLLDLNDPYQRRMNFTIVTPGVALGHWPT